MATRQVHTMRSCVLYRLGAISVRFHPLDPPEWHWALQQGNPELIRGTTVANKCTKVVQLFVYKPRRLFLSPWYRHFATLSIANTCAQHNCKARLLCTA